MKRRDDQCEAVASIRAQAVLALETIVVIDHLPGLPARANRELLGITAIAYRSSRQAELRGGRQAGASLASTGANGS